MTDKTSGENELSYEEVLKKNGTLIFTPGGTSMQPLLRHHENPVVLIPVSGRLRRGDVPFYKRPDGQYVLHRILKVRKNSYDCCGDNQIVLEKGVTDDMIFAKMVGFYRGEHYCSTDDPAIRRYAERRMRSRKWRALKARLGSARKRLFPKKK